jgi:hypothetical protein
MMQPSTTSGAVAEAEFVGAQQRADRPHRDRSSSGRPPAPDAAAQLVQHQCLLGFGQADFPRAAGVLDRRHGEAPVPPS